MKQYLKPCILILSFESLGAKLQGSGVALTCSGVQCDSLLGAHCAAYGPNYVDIIFAQLGATCPENTLPSCTVSALSVNGVPVSNLGSICHVETDSGSLCPAGCGIEIRCSTQSLEICSDWGDVVQATVSCSGFDESVVCNNPF